MLNQFFTNYTDVTFLEKVKTNLRTCKSFAFSVSFIKRAGLVLLFKDIEAAVERGAKGRLITSTYQNFTDIESLKAFCSLMGRCSNFECHLDFDSFHDNSYSTLGYHSKGYLFEFDDYKEVVVGSSNITRYALLKNIEWDVAVADYDDNGIYAQAMEEFEDKWNSTMVLDSDIIKQYSMRLNYAIERWDMDYDLSVSKIKPNYMQKKALKELNRYRAVGVNRALTIASAGSGKTYLAAFDALNFNPKKLLYIVHEGSILKKSIETFQEIFGKNVTYGMYGGGLKEIEADFLFATNKSMCKAIDTDVPLFSKDEFDYIIVDECHHATADTYRKIISYFDPEFLLGLTATPERLDNQDVFELFDHNVPYELRLRDAIANDLVVPFKYYGIRDKLVDYGLPSNQERKMISQMADEKHCDFISTQIEKHRPQGKLKALAFCRNVTHARMMAEALGEHYNTAYLTGRNDIGERIRAYNDLQDDASELEILFTVDILNEGVDIPGVNMVLFLRPTESSTIFIQQLGRGLRKYMNKEYVKVLDFIGNSYKRSVQIAFALGSLSENFVMEKRLMATLVKDDFTALGLAEYGVEIHIDDLSKEEILDYIDNENFNAIKYLKQDYFNFKMYIGSEYYPRHVDYINNDCAPDLIRFMSVKMQGKKNNSYYNFLKGIDETNLPIFTDTQIGFINYLSGLLPLVWTYEYQIVSCMLGGCNLVSDIKINLAEAVRDFDDQEFEHALKFLQGITVNKNIVSFDVEMDDQLKEYVDDLLEYGLIRYKVDNGEETGFKLYNNYRMDQVLLKLLQNPRHNQYGTYYIDDFVVAFAQLKKDLPDDDKLNYKNKFLQSDVFQWESMNNLSDADYSKLTTSKYVHLFVRKVEAENGITLPHTYVGKGKLCNPRKTDSGNGTYLFDIHMENELPDYLQYDFGLTRDL